MTFPDDFNWGASTSAYQIEGGQESGHRGPSIWDRFSHTEGAIVDGTDGDVACDHHRLFREDVGLMTEIGLSAYRFSVSWPRVLPSGVSEVSERGLDFYDRLVDLLSEAGIEPFVTLYHWDLPLALEERSGWRNRDSAHWFSDFAATVVNRLKDRVRFWITLNDPLSTAAMGHLYGLHAPGRRGGLAEFFEVSHNLNRAHREALGAIRAIDETLQVGQSNAASAIYPHHPEEDTEIVEYAHQFINEISLSPAMRGVYPKHLTAIMMTLGRSWLDDDLEPIGRRMDFVGINNYTRRFVTRSPGSPLPFEVVPSDAAAAPKTDLGWEIFPTGLREVLNRVRKDYDSPVIYVTENGAAFADRADPDGRIRDTKRTGFLSDHIQQMLLAIDDGCDVRGYFVWSLLDNFEWQHGLSKRSGLIYVDYQTQARTIKESGRWYGEVCRSNEIE